MPVSEPLAFLASVKEEADHGCGGDKQKHHFKASGAAVWRNAEYALDEVHGLPPVRCWFGRRPCDIKVKSTLAEGVLQAPCLARCLGLAA
jgi:hypothetical protein